MDTRRFLIGASVLETVTALSYPVIYLLPFRVFGTAGYWTPISLATSVLALMFLLLPLLALAGVLKGWRLAVIALGLWPAVAFVFGVIPLPFGHLLYTEDPAANTIVIAVADLLLLAAVAWLAIAKGPRSNNTVEADARKSGARGSP